MILNVYPILLDEHAARGIGDSGWYVAELTDCDTVIYGDTDGRQEIPFTSKADAQSYIYATHGNAFDPY